MTKDKGSSRGFVDPLKLIIDAKLSAKPDSPRFEREERIRSAFNRVTVDMSGLDLAAKAGLRFEQRQVEIGFELREPKSGGEPSNAAADDRDSISAIAAQIQPASLARSRTSIDRSAISSGSSLSISIRSSCIPSEFACDL